MPLPDLTIYVPQALLIIIALALIDWVVGIVGSLLQRTFAWVRVPDQLYSIGLKFLVPVGIAAWTTYVTNAGAGWRAAVELACVGVAGKVIAEIVVKLQNVIAGQPVGAKHPAAIH